MLLNEFIIRCSKIEHRKLNLSIRPIELHINEVDTDEICTELKSRGIKIYSQEDMNKKDEEFRKLEDETDRIQYNLSGANESYKRTNLNVLNLLQEIHDKLSVYLDVNKIHDDSIDLYNLLVKFIDGSNIYLGK